MGRTDFGSEGFWTIDDVIENEWKVLKILGGPRESGFGIVYVLQNLINGGVDAAKTFQQLLEEDTDSLRAKFRSEARIWNRLAGHPNIVEPRGVTELCGLPFMMSDYIEEGDLSLPIRSGCYKDQVAEVCELGMQLCDGMNFALRHGVKAHLDIKPTNCLLRKGHLKLCDFGLARTLDGFEFQTAAAIVSKTNLNLIRSSGGMVAGTEMYMAPEQTRQPECVDHRADIFAAGLMMLEMVTGLRPRNEADEIPKGQNVRNGKLRSVLKKCFSLEPEDRFQSFDELRDSLAHVYLFKTGKPAHKGVVELEMGALRKGKDGVYYLDPTSTHRTLLRRVSDLMTTEDHEELTKLECYVEEQITLYPNSYYLRIASANLCQVLHHDSTAAVSKLSEAIHNPDVPSLTKALALYEQGIHLLRLGKDDRAAVAFKDAITIDPTFGDTHFQLGFTSYRRCRWEEALPRFEEALRLNPDSEDSYLLLGRTLVFLKQYGEAENVFKAGLSRVKRSVDLTHFLSLLLMWHDRAAEAIILLDSTVMNRPESPQLHDDVACAHLLTRNLMLAEEAEAVCQRLLPPPEPHSLIMSAEVCVEAARENDWPRCLKMVKEMVMMGRHRIDPPIRRG